MTVDVASSGRSPRRGRRATAVNRPAARHRLQVLATSVDEVVLGAGGWLADRALAGWDIEVLLAEPPSDPLRLRILGVSAGALHGKSRAGTERPDAVAVSAQLYAQDGKVREDVLRAYDRDLVEVTVWGAVIPAELSSRFTPVEHTLSGAARAFKGHALSVEGHAHCGTAPLVAAAEQFSTGALRGLSDDLTAR